MRKPRRAPAPPLTVTDTHGARLGSATSAAASGTRETSSTPAGKSRRSAYRPVRQADVAGIRPRERRRCSGNRRPARRQRGGGHRLAFPGNRAPTPPKRRAARRQRARGRGCQGDERTDPSSVRQRRRARAPIRRAVQLDVGCGYGLSGASRNSPTAAERASSGRRRSLGGGANTAGAAGVRCAKVRPSARIAVMLSLPPASFAAAISACTASAGSPACSVPDG